MLVDVKFQKPDVKTSLILGLVADGQGPTIPERIGEGMYQCGHWSIDLLGLPLKDKYGSTPSLNYEIETSGVCDYPEQVLEKFPILKEHPAPFFISFVKLRRGDQPREGGWRWHKWGTYIGDKNPQCEYLHDEPEIEEVYTFSVYELDEANNQQ